MSEYYGVSTPTDDFLAHYGVKGMKWGIRRALKYGNSMANPRLSKQYKKAVARLGKMSIKANNAVNEKKYQDWRQKARKSALSGALGGATGGVIGSLHGAASAGARYGMSLPQVLEKVPQVKTMAAQFGGAGLIAGGLGGYTGGRLRAHVYKRRQDPVVRAKLLAKRDKYRQEMENAFKGTVYGGKKQKQFHKDISRLANANNPKEYIRNQYNKANNEYKRSIKRKRI